MRIEATATRRVLLLIPTRTYRAEAFIEAAHALDVAVTVGSEETSSMEHLNPAALLTLDFARPEEAASKALEFSHTHDLRAVVAVDDGAALAGAAVAQALDLPHNPIEAIRAAQDKRRMRARLEGKVPQPAFRVLGPDDDLEQLGGEVGYPCVVKPCRLAGSRGVLRANDAGELRAAVSRIRALLARPDVEGGPELLLEEYVFGWEVAVEGLIREGELEVLAVFDKPDPLTGPTFAESIYVTPSRLPAETQASIAALTARAVAALGLRDGPVHAELRGTGPDDLWFIEVAARSIGGLCSRALRFGVGVSLEELILRQALDLPIESLERERTAAGVRMLSAPRAGVFRALRGQCRAERIPGVEEVVLTVHEDQRLEPLPEGATYLGFVFARGETPAQVEAALRAADRELDIIIDPISEEDSSS